MDIWSMIATERRALADDLDDLTDAQWAAPSLCDDWRVRDVVAHVVFPFRVSLPSVMFKMVRHKFDFNAMSDAEARGDTRPPAELVATLRANADHRFHPPGFGPEAPLTDVVIHGQDIRRPLGLAREFDPDALGEVLDLLTSAKATRGFVAKGRVDGLTFAATDLDRTWGSGPTVSGTGEALALALAGRTVTLDELAGDGLDTLRARS